MSSFWSFYYTVGMWIKILSTFFDCRHGVAQRSTDLQTKHINQNELCEYPHQIDIEIHECRDILNKIIMHSIC